MFDFNEDVEVIISLGLPFRLILIGGAERSGTTALHALLTTSPSTNSFVPEAGMIQRFLGAWCEGWASFHGDTGQYYFDTDRVKFLELFKATFVPLIEQVWRNLESPAVLVLKSPAFSLSFNALSQMTDSIELVATIRQPEDVLVSQFRVFNTRKKGSGNVSANWVRRNARAMLSYYNFNEDSVTVIRHEDFSSSDISNSLEKLLGLKGIDYKELSSKQWLISGKGDPWGSELYGKPIQKVSTDYSEINISQWVDIVDKEAKTLKERYGYTEILS